MLSATRAAGSHRWGIDARASGLRSSPEQSKKRQRSCHIQFDFFQVFTLVQIVYNLVILNEKFYQNLKFVLYFRFVPKMKLAQIDKKLATCGS